MEYLLWDHLGDVPGIKNQHLRYILFWMCEKNFRDWQEARLGIKLKAYLKTLYNSLSSESLPHYFIMSCNMMENIPEKYIRQTQVRSRVICERKGQVSDLNGFEYNHVDGGLFFSCLFFFFWLSFLPLSNFQYSNWMNLNMSLLVVIFSHLFFFFKFLFTVSLLVFDLSGFGHVHVSSYLLFTFFFFFSFLQLS